MQNAAERKYTVLIAGDAKICPEKIPDDLYDAGCRVLQSCIKRFFMSPENRREYEEWHKTPEGRIADMKKEERDRVYAMTEEQRTRYLDMSKDERAKYAVTSA